MKPVTQQLLLILFVLLQCIAPLAHAHIDGTSSDHATHSHEISVHSLSVSNYTHMERHELAVISMPQAFTVSKVLSPDHTPPLQTHDRLTPIRISNFFSFPEPPTLVIADPGYLFCLAQAPPQVSAVP